MNAILRDTAPESARDAVQRLFAKDLRAGYTIAGCHRYNAADGSELFHAVRLKHAICSKLIRPIHRMGARYFISRPERPASGWPLYSPPYPLVEADPIFIVEGEACADALAKLGLTAITSGSASSADAANWAPLAGRACVIWPDNDIAGSNYARAVMTQLRGIGCDVRLIAQDVIEALPISGDCADWITANPNAASADIRGLSTAAVLRDAQVPDDEPRVILVNAADVQSRPVRWIWPGWLARGKLHVLAGAPGTGKTTIAMHWAACVSAGCAFPSGWRPSPGRVLIWSGEDDIGDTLKPRLSAAGADLSLIQFVDHVRIGRERVPFDPARDVGRLAAAVAGIEDVALIVIDPLVSAVLGDSHKNAEVRRSLAPLVELAARMDAALVGITHYSKGTQGREPLERVSGSLAFGALARVVFGTVKQQTEGDGGDRYLLARMKSNVGPDGDGFVYAFEQHEPEPGIDASRVVWGAALEGSARELLGEAESGHGATAQDAASFLSDLLADGSIPAKTIFAESKEAGYSRDVMRRAKHKIGAQAEKRGMEGGWFWRLSREVSAEDSEGGAQIRPPSSPSSGVQLPSSGEIEVFEL